MKKYLEIDHSSSYFKTSESTKNFSEFFDETGFIRAIDLVEDLTKKLTSKLENFKVINRDMIQTNYGKGCGSTVFERVYSRDITNDYICITVNYSQEYDSGDNVWDLRGLGLSCFTTPNDYTTEFTIYGKTFAFDEVNKADKVIERIFNYVIENIDSINQMIEEKKKIIKKKEKLIRREKEFKGTLKTVSKSFKKGL